MEVSFIHYNDPLIAVQSFRMYKQFFLLGTTIQLKFYSVLFVFINFNEFHIFFSHFIFVLIGYINWNINALHIMNNMNDGNSETVKESSANKKRGRKKKWKRFIHFQRGKKMYFRLVNFHLILFHISHFQHAYIARCARLKAHFNSERTENSDKVVELWELHDMLCIHHPENRFKFRKMWIKQRQRERWLAG